MTNQADTAPDQVARLLALVPYLLARGEVRLDDAAAHFDTDAEQIERDLRLLFMTGLSPGLPGDLIEVDLDALEGDRVIRMLAKVLTEGYDHVFVKWRTESPTGREVYRLGPFGRD